MQVSSAGSQRFTCSWLSPERVPVKAAVGMGKPLVMRKDDILAVCWLALPGILWAVFLAVALT